MCTEMSAGDQQRSSFQGRLSNIIDTTMISCARNDIQMVTLFISWPLRQYLVIMYIHCHVKVCELLAEFEIIYENP